MHAQINASGVTRISMALIIYNVPTSDPNMGFFLDSVYSRNKGLWNLPSHHYASEFQRMYRVFSNQEELRIFKMICTKK